MSRERSAEATERLGDWILASDGKLYPPGIEFVGTPLAGLAVASDETLRVLALDGQLRSARDEQDRYTMTADKLSRLLGAGE